MKPAFFPRGRLDRKGKTEGKSQDHGWNTDADPQTLGHESKLAVENFGSLGSPFFLSIQGLPVVDEETKTVKKRGKPSHKRNNMKCFQDWISHERVFYPVDSLGAKDLNNGVKPLWIILGFLAFTLGIIGIFLPVMPTTPFLLLAAYFFSKGSQRLHFWLTQHPWFRDIYQNWQRDRSVPLKAKWGATLALMGSITFLIFAKPIAWAGIAGIGLFFAGVLTYLWTRPTS